MNAHETEAEYRDPYIEELGDSFTVEGMETVKKIIGAIRAYGGEANTTDIRHHTGISRSSYHYFFDRLLDYDIITREYEQGEENKVKVAILTDKGHDMWAKNVFDRWIDQHNTSTNVPEVDDRGDELHELRTRVTALEKIVEDLQAEVATGDD